MSRFKAFATTVVIAITFTAADPSLAAQGTFATFTPIGTAKNVRFVNDGTGDAGLASGGSSGSLYSTATAADTAKGLLFVPAKSAIELHHRRAGQVRA